MSGAAPPSLTCICRSLLVQTVCNVRLPFAQATDGYYQLLKRQLQAFPVVATAVGLSLLDAIVSKCPDTLTDEFLLSLLPSTVRRINLQGCTRLSLSAVCEVLKRCIKCFSRSAIFAKILISEALHFLLRCTHIQRLNFASCDQLAGLDFGERLPQHLSHLTALELSNCDSLRDKTVQVQNLQLTMIKKPFSFMYCTARNFRQEFNFVAFIEATF